MQSTKLTKLVDLVKCWLDKTNNSNKTMYAFLKKVLNEHDKIDD